MASGLGTYAAFRSTSDRAYPYRRDRAPRGRRRATGCDFADGHSARSSSSNLGEGVEAPAGVSRPQSAASEALWVPGLAPPNRLEHARMEGYQRVMDGAGGQAGK